MSARILVVDDDNQQRTDIAEMIESLGFEVATATNGEDALAKLNTFPADVILTDLVMPRMDGVALLTVLAERGDQDSNHCSDGVRQRRSGNFLRPRS